MKKTFLIFAIFSGLMLTSCSNSGHKFIGTWMNSNGEKLIITTAGKTAYTVTMIGARDGYGFATKNTFTATYKGGNLLVMGQVIASYSDGKIISDGKKYKKMKRTSP